MINNINGIFEKKFQISFVFIVKIRENSIF